jgi:serine/threonine protein kinase
MPNASPDPEVTLRKTVHLAGSSSSVSESHHSTVMGNDAPVAKLPGLPEPFKPGDRIADFELLQPLGKGGFATVWLAKQLSLGRQVALKVSPNRGHEAQTLASLEHDHIVHVFSETIIDNGHTRLLCMQYVAGATLQDVLNKITPAMRQGESGQPLLKAIDAVCRLPEEFRPGALQERQQLEQVSFFEAVCLLGIKLCSALEFAHGQSVLHRDIKPANILVNSYGRPFLADFNLATQAEANQPTPVGGTLPYMAPEQLRAFTSRDWEAWKLVDDRSDLYGLGVVLHELATGYRPYARPHEARDSTGDDMSLLFDDRFVEVEPLNRLCPAVPDSLDRVIRRAVAPEPTERFATATELRTALEQCQTHLQRMRQMPSPPRWLGVLHRHPFLSLLLIATLTNMLATAVNFSYNLVQIVGDFAPAQQNVFYALVMIYNTLAFPLLVGLTAWLIHRSHRDWQTRRTRLVSDDETITLRGRIHFLATWSILGSLSGWLPGGIIFPLAINWWGSPLTAPQFLHFIVSFTLSGLIAITYCFLGSQYVVLRVLVPELCFTMTKRDKELRGELALLPYRLAVFQLLAGLIPLSGALLLLVIGPTHDEAASFRLLVGILIVLGMVGLVLALQITHYLQRVLQVLLQKPV